MLTRIWKSKGLAATGQFLTTAFIYWGLAILAWGPSHLNTFFMNPVRTGFTIIAVVQSLFMAWVVYVTPPHIEPEHRFDIPRWHAYLFETIFVLAAFSDQRDNLVWDENMPLRWTGTVIYLIGLALSVWTNTAWIGHLKRDGGHAQEIPVLIYEGPFRWIRYPSMVSLFFYCLGFTFMFRSWVGLALMPFLVWGIINRINNIERIFEERYKKIWPMRRHASKRVIPYVY
jgi:protein-S-isoprenylcysteine O-methyltransferase Ste14